MAPSRQTTPAATATPSRETTEPIEQTTSTLTGVDANEFAQFRADAEARFQKQEHAFDELRSKVDQFCADTDAKLQEQADAYDERVAQLRAVYAAKLQKQADAFDEFGSEIAHIRDDMPARFKHLSDQIKLTCGMPPAISSNEQQAHANKELHKVNPGEKELTNPDDCTVTGAAEDGMNKAHDDEQGDRVRFMQEQRKDTQSYRNEQDKRWARNDQKIEELSKCFQRLQNPQSNPGLTPPPTYFNSEAGDPAAPLSVPNPNGPTDDPLINNTLAQIRQFLEPLVLEPDIGDKQPTDLDYDICPPYDNIQFENTVDADKNFSNLYTIQLKLYQVGIAPDQWIQYLQAHFSPDLRVRYDDIESQYKIHYYYAVAFLTENYPFEGRFWKRRREIQGGDMKLPNPKHRPLKWFVQTLSDLPKYELLDTKGDFMHSFAFACEQQCEALPAVLASQFQAVLDIYDVPKYRFYSFAQTLTFAQIYSKITEVNREATLILEELDHPDFDRYKNPHNRQRRRIKGRRYFCSNCTCADCARDDKQHQLWRATRQILDQERNEWERNADENQLHPLEPQPDFEGLDEQINQIDEILEKYVPQSFCHNTGFWDASDNEFSASETNDYHTASSSEDDEEETN